MQKLARRSRSTRVKARTRRSRLDTRKKHFLGSRFMQQLDRSRRDPISRRRQPSIDLLPREVHPFDRRRGPYFRAGDSLFRLGVTDQSLFDEPMVCVLHGSKPMRDLVHGHDPAEIDRVRDLLRNQLELGERGPRRSLRFPHGPKRKK